MTGGMGRTALSNFYRDHFIFCNPPDTALNPISRTVGPDRVVGMSSQPFCLILTNTNRRIHLYMHSHHHHPLAPAQHAPNQRQTLHPHARRHQHPRRQAVSRTYLVGSSHCPQTNWLPAQSRISQRLRGQIARCGSRVRAVAPRRTHPQ